MNNTLFQRIASGEIPAAFAYRDEEIFAIRDINPQAPIHLLIIPIKPIPSLLELSTEDAELIGKMVLIATKLARESGLAPNGFRLVFNCGDDGGQTVPHIHLHLMGGRRMQWPPG